MSQEARIKLTFVVTISLQSLSMGWFSGTYVLFLLAHGLTLFDANLLNLGFMAANFLLDPPTGILADRFGQKRVYLFGQLAWGASMLFYGFGTNFWQFLGAELIGAVGSALVSGSLDSWLRNHVGETQTHKSLAQAGVASRLVTIPTALLGSIVGARFGLEWPWFLGAATFGVTTIITYFMLRLLPETYNQPAHLTLSGITLQTFTNRSLRFTLAVAFFSTLCFQPFNMFWAPIFKEMSGQAWWFGSLWAGIALFTAFGSHASRGQWQQLNGRGIGLSIVITGASMLITPFIPNVGVVILLFLFHELGRGALQPLLFTYANRHIPNHIRSTSNSIRTAFSTLGAGIGLLISGYFTFFLTPLTIWGIAAFGLVLLALWAFFRKE